MSDPGPVSGAGGARLTVLSPWYPSPINPFAGAFVEAMVEAATPLFADVEVVHIEAWGLPAVRGAWRLPLPRLVGRTVARGYRRLAAASPTAIPIVGPHGLRRIPVPLPSGKTFAYQAELNTKFLRYALSGGRLAGDVVHAHVGLRGGWPAVELARPDARVFVTEHATYLDQVFAQADSRTMYDKVIERCTGFFCVSEVLRQRVVEEFPHHSAKISVVPNPIPFEELEVRPEPPKELRRWLFAGNFIERKGVHHLLEAFARCHRDDLASELTLVGGGVLRDRLERRAGELGLADHVHFVSGLPRAQVFELMRVHDVLVHPSSYETFGMTVVEAIASGTPVLVTDCGGPAETLEGVSDLAGEILPLPATASVIVQGFGDLAERLAELDLTRARAVLQSRYGYQAVADTLAKHYSPTGHPGELTS